MENIKRLKNDVFAPPSFFRSLPITLAKPTLKFLIHTAQAATRQDLSLKEGRFLTSVLVVLLVVRGQDKKKKTRQLPA